MIPKVYDRWLARQSVVSWIYVFVGSVVLSAGFVLFMNPYRIVPGGVYGAGIVLHYLFPSVQVGTFGLMLDIPLLLVGMKVFGRAFGAKTIFSALLIPLSMNAMTWLFGESPETLFGGAMNLSQDMFLPCIFGGVLIGAGTGLFIVSDRREQIREYILERMGRGGTYLKASGLYTARDKEVIFVVVSRGEVSMVRSMVHEIDPTAFVVIVDADETYGDGFKPFPQKE